MPVPGTVLGLGRVGSWEDTWFPGAYTGLKGESHEEAIQQGIMGNERCVQNRVIMCPVYMWHHGMPSEGKKTTKGQ